MILVFKTNIDTIHKIDIVEPMLNSIFHKTNWNFDLEDCDNILRIDTTKNSTHLIIEKITAIGFYCEELL
jgi:hypothetical protein